MVSLEYKYIQCQEPGMRLQESIEEAREPILYCNSVCVCV